MIDISSAFSNLSGSGPYGYQGKNATGAGATDGTEFIAAMIDNFMFGWSQALLSHESITIDGITEAEGASQILDAIQNIVPPGMVMEWNLNTDPATYGARYLLLNGQGILVANYAQLVANVYVGDANNAAVAAAGGAYYRADDAAGTIPNTSGAYLILPESRGYTTRGLDAAASVDPDGASRYLGDNQLDAFQGHYHSVLNTIHSSTGPAGGAYDSSRLAGGSAANNGADSANTAIQSATNDGSSGIPRISSESRMTNRSTKFAIRF